jgi:hypothetical protein
VKTSCFRIRFRIVSALLIESKIGPDGKPKLPGEAFVVSEASGFETAKKVLKVRLTQGSVLSRDAAPAAPEVSSKSGSEEIGSSSKRTA